MTLQWEGAKVRGQSERTTGRTTVVKLLGAAITVVVCVPLVGGPPSVTTIDCGCEYIQAVWGSRVVFDVSEADAHADLNGDGDTQDSIIHIYEHTTKSTTSTGLSGTIVKFDSFGNGVALDATGGIDREPQARVHVGRYALVYVDERAQGNRDLNEDGDANDLVPHVIDLLTLEQRNLRNIPAEGGLLVTTPFVEDSGALPQGPSCLVYAVSESLAGEDWNGDSDLDDIALEMRNLETGVATVLPITLGHTETAQLYRLSYPWIAYLGPGGSDWDYLPSGGEFIDLVLHIYNAETGMTHHLARNLTVFNFSFCVADWLVWQGSIEGGGCVPYVFDLVTGESKHFGWTELPGGYDFASCSNRGVWQVYGDSACRVLVGNRDTGEVRSLGIGSGGWGEYSCPWYRISGKWLVLVPDEDESVDNDYVVNVHNLETGETFSTGLRPALSTILGAEVAAFGDWLVVTWYEAGGVRSVMFDLDERMVIPFQLHDAPEAWSLGRSASLAAFCVPKEGADALQVITYQEAASPFLRADSNDDGTLDLSDPVATLGYLFLGTEALPCLDAADADDSGGLEITDAIYSLSFQFLGGPSPPPPFGRCGADPTADELGCEGFEGCP